MKTAAVPMLGTAEAMAAAARAAGLARVHSEERQVDVGVTEPGQLVRYRLGHPAFAAWLDAIGPGAPRVATAAEHAIREACSPTGPSSCSCPRSPPATRRASALPGQMSGLTDLAYCRSEVAKDPTNSPRIAPTRLPCVRPGQGRPYFPDCRFRETAPNLGTLRIRLREMTVTVSSLPSHFLA